MAEHFKSDLANYHIESKFIAEIKTARAYITQELASKKKLQTIYAEYDFSALAKFYAELYRNLEKVITKTDIQNFSHYIYLKFCTDMHEIWTFKNKPNGKKIEKWYHKIRREYEQLRKIHSVFATKCKEPEGIAWFCEFFGTARPFAENQLFGYLYQLNKLFIKMFVLGKKISYYEENSYFFSDIKTDLCADYGTERFLRHLFIKQISALGWTTKASSLYPKDAAYNICYWSKTDDTLYEKIETCRALPFLLIYKNKKNQSQLVDDPLSRANLIGDLFGQRLEKKNAPDKTKSAAPILKIEEKKIPQKYKHQRENFMLSIDLSKSDKTSPRRRLFHPEWKNIAHMFVPIFTKENHLDVQMLFLLLVHKGILKHSPIPPTDSRQIIDLLLKTDFAIIVMRKISD